MSSREDPMFNLLSSVGGIDSSRFQKPQSMKDQRVGQSLPSDKSQAGLSTKKSNAERSDRGAQVSQAIPGRDIRGAKPSIVQAGPKPVMKGGQGDSNSQLDSLLEGSLFNKSNRPMRDDRAAQPLAQQTRAQTVEKQEAPKVMHDDLDAVFGSAGGSFSQQGSDRGNTGDPFELFGGLGTSQQAASTGSASHEADLLPGMSGVESESRSPPASSPWDLEKTQPQPSRQDSEPWGSMTGAARSSDERASRRPGLRIDSPASRASTSPPSETALPARTSSQTGMQGPPPSYESVVRSPNSSRLASPRGSRVSSPRASSRFQAYKSEEEEDGEEAGRKQAASRRPRRADSLEKQQSKLGNDRLEQQYRQEGDVRDQAKQWLSAGRDWLSGASKKVAQAVKETQAQINSRLEELDTRHSQGHHGSPPKSSSQPRRQAGEAAKPGPRTDGDISDIPQYYFEWAATISDLPGHEQGVTLAAMPEEDASNIRRILRHTARRQSQELTEDAMLAAAKQRSLREEKTSSHEQRSLSPVGPGRRSLSSELTPSKPQQAAAAPAATTAQRPRPRPQSASGSQPRDRPQRPSQQQRESQGSGASVDLMGLNLEDRGTAAAASQQDEALTNGNAGMNDLMGLHGPSSTAKPQAKPREEADLDMLGLSSNGSQAGAEAKSVTSPARNVVHDDLFSNSATTAGPQTSPDIEALFGNAPAAAQSQGKRSGRADSMIDFGEEGPSAAGLTNFYQSSAQNEAQEGEPEERKVARQKRLAAQQARIQKQLQEKMDRDRAEEQKREAQHDHRLVHRERIEAWKSGKKDNIRALLSTLHTILWENSGWSAPGMTDLVEPSKVKRSYMKANLVVHPDKVKQKGGTVEQIVIADMAFDTLKTAWSKFETTELQRR